MKAFLNRNYLSLIHSDGGRCDFIYDDPKKASEAFVSLSRYIELTELSKLSRLELLDSLKGVTDWRKHIRDFANINSELDLSLKLTLMSAYEIIDVKRHAVSTYVYEKDGIKTIDEQQN